MTELALHTRQSNQVGNICDPNARTHGITAVSDDYKRRYPTAFHRSTEPTDTYNCHGLTFGARRTRIYRPAEVRKILADDGYHEVFPPHVEPGDIIVYFDEQGDADHSGIVVEIAKRADDSALLVPTPKVLSKWGSCHEVVHFFNDCPYSLRTIRYFRMKQ
ncbi:hypothetical protein E5675_07395 [Sphingopyxis sp. PAMC25046]|uniref:hypothetical protein n=1 Tax=Sphingopyxis sp. PAMC25046 TaxID=2565556 RepID=UPI00109DD99B|nr:hypothetical protein [Sphingopyxis sp. PAMC25046]QCB54275.1 hypothetical protein E5675_07395 [Sphingopyxis sp. PAMC25046]